MKYITKKLNSVRTHWKLVGALLLGSAAITLSILFPAIPVAVLAYIGITTVIAPSLVVAIAGAATFVASLATIKVLSYFVKYFDYKINPRCNLIRLDKETTNLNINIEKRYLTNRVERTYFLVGDEIYVPATSRSITMFRKLDLRQDDAHNKHKIDVFKSKFEAEYDVKREISFLKLRNFISIASLGVVARPASKPRLSTVVEIDESEVEEKHNSPKGYSFFSGKDKNSYITWDSIDAAVIYEPGDLSSSPPKSGTIV